MNTHALTNIGIILGSMLAFAAALWAIAQAFPPNHRLYRIMQFVGTAAAGTAIGLITFFVFTLLYLKTGIITPSRP